MPNPCHYQNYDRSMLYPAQSGSEGCRKWRGVEVADTSPNLWKLGGASIGTGGAWAPLASQGRCRANMAHIRQSRPDSGLGFHIEVLKIFSVVLSSRGSGLRKHPDTPGPFQSPLGAATRLRHLGRDQNLTSRMVGIMTRLRVQGLGIRV